MKVADLQQHLADLGRLLEASGAKNVASDLAAIRDGFAPFADLPLKGFADFLRRAEAFSRGDVPVASKAGRMAAKTIGGGAKKEAADPSVLAREARDLYDRAAELTVTPEIIEALAGRLDGLAKAGVLTVAEAIDLKGMKSKAKGDVVAAIRQRILGRKGATIRAGLIDRGPLNAEVQPTAIGSNPSGDGVPSHDFQ